MNLRKIVLLFFLPVSLLSFSQNTLAENKPEIIDNDSIHCGGTIDTVGFVYLDSSYIYADTSGWLNYDVIWYGMVDTFATAMYVDTKINISEFDGDFGMIIQGADTFAVVHIDYIKTANLVFVDKDYYKQLSDSLGIILTEKDKIVSDLRKQISELTLKNSSQEEVSGLYKEEADDCKEKYDKLVKKYKRSRNVNKGLGVVSGVAVIVVAILLL